MPIRTNRGRAAVYRRLWGWPLRSPRHLVVTLVVVAVLAIAVAVVAARTGSGRTPQAGGGAAAGASSTSPAPASSAAGTTNGTTGSGAAPTTRLASPPETPKSAPPAPEAISVIEAWGQAWVNHPVGMTNAAWLAQLQQYTEPELLGQMGTVNVANIDATQLTGAATAKNSFTSSVEALLPTNAGTLDVTAIKDPTRGWLVSSYTEAS
jgi:hypothetical protein